MIIVFCADRNLYKNLPTTLNSLFANNDPDKVYLFIEDDDISYIKHLDPKFNVIGRSWQTYGKQEIVIRHYAGITKPWKADADPKDKEFWNKYYTKELIY